MSQRVTLDNSELRSRLRSAPVAHRGSSYQARSGLAGSPASSHAAKPVISDVVTAKPGAALDAALRPRQGAIEELIVFPAAQEEVEDIANAVARQRAEVVKKMAAQPGPLERSARRVQQVRSVRRPHAASAAKPAAHAEPRVVASEPALTVQPDADHAQDDDLSVFMRQEFSAPAARRSAVWRPVGVAPAPQAAAAQQPAPVRHRRGLKLKLTQSKVLMVMAATVFLVGLGVSIMGIRANREAAAQALAVSSRVDASAASATANGSKDSGGPSTTPVSADAMKNYAVAPDLARYITIPAINVYARVLQVGVTTNGALGTPANVFDTAWYTGSAKPGQPGATLIDGHVSSWTSHGVFYNLKNLKAGDKIQIQKGNGQILNYSVVKTQTFNAGNTDMQSLMVSADSSKPGLNLITCGGTYDKNSKEFTERVAVYAVLN